jgi:large subunit ribosomal protein L22
MEARANAKYIRMSPRKIKVVLDLIRGKNAAEAMAILRLTPRAAAPVVAKLLKSAMANAENNNKMDVTKLFVAETYAGPGPVLKRFQPHAQGRAFRIAKRTSHITMVLKERA